MQPAKAGCMAASMRSRYAMPTSMIRLMTLALSVVPMVLCDKRKYGLHAVAFNAPCGPDSLRSALHCHAPISPNQRGGASVVLHNFGCRRSVAGGGPRTGFVGAPRKQEMSPAGATVQHTNGMCKLLSHSDDSIDSNGDEENFRIDVSFAEGMVGDEVLQEMVCGDASLLLDAVNRLMEPCTFLSAADVCNLRENSMFFYTCWLW